MGQEERCALCQINAAATAKTNEDVGCKRAGGFDTLINVFTWDIGFDAIKDLDFD